METFRLTAGYTGAYHEVRNRCDYRMMGKWFLILSVFLTQLLVYTWSRVQCVQIGYEISRETETYQHLVTLQNALKIEMERLRSPERIGRIARYKLGLVPPMPQQKKIILVNETH